MATTVNRARRPVAPTKELTSLAVEGFKCIRQRQEIVIRPLTLLAGANSSGKSSILQPLLLMKQTLEAPFDPGALLLNGPCVRVNEAKRLLWRGRRKDDVSEQWKVTIGTTGETVTSAFGISQGPVLAWSEIQLGSQIARFAEGTSQAVREGDLGGYVRVTGTAEPRTERCYHVVNVFLSGALFPAHTLVPLPVNLLRDLIHLPGLRGNPERSYRVARVSRQYPGSFSDYTASVVLGWQDGENESLIGVGEDLKTLGLSWKVAARRLDDSQVEINVGRLPRPQRGGSQDVVNIADVGFGASQVLPVVVALRAAVRGQLLHIEQPELHLHPNAQVAMASLLINAAKRGVRVVVETHSSVLLSAVQVAVAEGFCAPDLVALHWFKRDEEGATEITSAKVGKDGGYGDWPVDFADVEMGIARRLINAAFKVEGR